MKIFFKHLNYKEKFIRALWTGLLALLFLYVVVWNVVDDLTLKIVLPLAVTVVYLTDLLIRYNRWKRNVESTI